MPSIEKAQEMIENHKYAAHWAKCTFCSSAYIAYHEGREIVALPVEDWLRVKLKYNFSTKTNGIVDVFQEISDALGGDVVIPQGSKGLVTQGRYCSGIFNWLVEFPVRFSFFQRDIPGFDSNYIQGVPHEFLDFDDGMKDAFKKKMESVRTGHIKSCELNHLNIPLYDVSGNVVWQPRKK